MTAELESYLQDTVDWDSKWFADFNAGKTQLVSSARCPNNGANDVIMDGSVFVEKSLFNSKCNFAWNILAMPELVLLAAT